MGPLLKSKLFNVEKYLLMKPVYRHKVLASYRRIKIKFYEHIATNKNRF
jgi:hypothetical protein